LPGVTHLFFLDPFPSLFAPIKGEELAGIDDDGVSRLKEELVVEAKTASR
jgi:hypothetical protein